MATAFRRSDTVASRSPAVTLEDAAAYIMKLPKTEQDLPEWQTATEVLMMAAEDRGPLMYARIGRAACFEPQRRANVN
jgi:hypothetical protein